MTTYVYNEHDENQVLTMRNKLKKKKRKRRIPYGRDGACAERVEGHPSGYDRVGLS